MNKVNQFLLWILSITMVMWSCDNKIDDKGKAGTLKRMDIAEAKLLFIASLDSGKRLYGIKKSSMLRSESDSNDEIYEINYLDENVEQVEEFTPSYLLDAGDYLIAVLKRVDGWFVEEKAYFVKKSDGSVYELQNEYIPSYSGYDELIFNYNFNKRSVMYNDNYINIVNDKNNNLYYTAIRCLSDGSCPDILYQVSSITSASINFKQISEVNDRVHGWCMDDAGNMIYSFNIWTEDRRMRYRSVDGSFSEPIPVIKKTNWDAPDEVYRFVWKGSDGFMALLQCWGEYNSDGGYTDFPNPRHYLMKMENGQFVKKRELLLEFGYGGNYPSSANVFYVKGQVIFNHYWGGTATLVDISNENSYREINCSVVANIVINDELYNFDKNNLSLTHINISNGSATPVFVLDKSALSDYHISNIMDVTENSVTFSAYRFSLIGQNQKPVVAKIGLDNVVTILQDNSGDISDVIIRNP